MFGNDRKYRGLGYDISKTSSLKEALAKSHLDWKVSEMPIEINRGGTKYSKVPGWKVLTRPDASLPEGIRVLDVPSAKYTVAQNSDIMEVFWDIAKMGEMKLETAGFINGGERVFAIAKISGEFFFPGVSDKNRIDHGEGRESKDDTTYLKILMGAAHVHGIANTIDVIAERQICTNGLRISENVNRWRFIHKRQFSQGDRDEVCNFVKGAQEMFKRYEQNARLLHGTKFPRELSEMFMVELEQPALLKEAVEHVKEKAKRLDPKSTEFKAKLTDHVLSKGDKYLNKGEYSLPVRQMVASIENQPGADMAPETGWNTYNAVTYYIDHIKGRTADTGIMQAFYGQGSVTKIAALNQAVNYCDRLQLIGK